MSGAVAVERYSTQNVQASFGVTGITVMGAYNPFAKENIVIFKTSTNTKSFQCPGEVVGVTLKTF